MSNNNENQEEEKPSMLEQAKDFGKRHVREIAIGGTIAGVTVVAIVVANKNPQLVDKAVTAVKSLLDKEHIGKAATIIENTVPTAEEIASQIASGELPEPDMSETLSAKRLGNLVGMTSREVNLKLHELGYLDGEPGNWRRTAKGMAYSIEKAQENGYGGYAAHGWGWFEWAKSLAYEIGDPDKHLVEVNRNRLLAGLQPLKAIKY